MAVFVKDGCENDFDPAACTIHAQASRSAVVSIPGRGDLVLSLTTKASQPDVRLLLQVHLPGEIVSTEVDRLEGSLLNGSDMVIDTYELVCPTLNGNTTTMACINCGDDQDS